MEDILYASSTEIHPEGDEMRGLIRCRRGSSSAYAVLLLVIMTCASGAVFFSFAVSQVDLAMDLCGLQLSVLLVQSLTINDARLTMWLRNAGNALVEITGGYVTRLIAALAGIVCVEPGSTSMTATKGLFTEACSYSVKLLSLFSTVLAFEITY